MQKNINDLLRKVQKNLGPGSLGQTKKQLIKLQKQLIASQHLRSQKLKFFLLIKQVVSAIGYQLRDCHFIDNPSDINFFLMEEFEALELGGFLDKDVKSLIERRKEEYLRYAESNYNLREFQITEFIPISQEAIDKMVEESPKPWGQLQGIGNHCGSVNGKVKKVSSLDDLSNINDKILLATKSSNLLSLTLPLAKGLLIEQTSHSCFSTSMAVTLHKPVVLNIPNVTGRVSEGQRLHLDSEEGIIEKLLDLKEKSSA